MLGRDTNPVQISDIYVAEKRIHKIVAPTPLVSLEPLNIQIGGRVYLKVESLLPGGAYKFRGALNKMLSLIDQFGKEIKIVTASSGNHGIACAIAAKRLGVPATVVVPVLTPQIKKDCIRDLGANLFEIGNTYDESFIAACELANKEGMYYVHPTSDRFIVSGQGTIGLEILQQLEDVDQVVVPIGGGGLIIGIAYVLKTLKPSVKIIGVMPEGSDVYYESRKAGKLLTLKECHSIADAVVRKTGEEYLYPYIEKYVDDIVVVTEDAIKRAIKIGALYGKLVLEGAAALPLAALMEKKFERTDGTVLICSGGNIDQKILEDCLKD